ncbi:MAG: putative RND superfamily exporter protein [Gammaproteobacteria bacterium]|jgi:predicted RND superfamily exporter protein
MKTIINHPWLVIAASLVLILLIGSGVRDLALKDDYRMFFSSDNPQLLSFEAFEDTYVKSDSVLIALAPDDGNVFSVDTLEAIRWLTEQSWQIPYSTRVDSIANFQHTYAEEDDLIVEDLVAENADYDEVAIQKIKSVALAEPLLVNRLISSDAKVASVNINISIQGEEAHIVNTKAVTAARELLDEFHLKFPAIQTYLTGTCVMMMAFPEAIERDGALLLPAALVLMMGILFFLLRSITATACTLVIILLSILAAFGSAGYVGFDFTPAVATSAIIILTMAVANCVHILMSFFYEIQNNKEPREAILESVRINMMPVSLASLTTMLGFLSLNFSEAPPFRQMGSTVAMGVFYSYLLSITLLPAILSKLRPGSSGRSRRPVLSLQALGSWIVLNNKRLLIAMAMLIVALTSLIPLNELNDTILHYFDDRYAFRRDTDFLTENLTGMYSIEYSLEASEAGGISEPVFLRRVSDFADWFREQEGVIHVSAFTDTMRRLNKNMHGDEESYYRLPDERELAAQYLFLYEMSLPYGLDLNDQINIDKSALRLTVTIETVSNKEILALDAAALTWLGEHAPEISTMGGTGVPVMFSHMTKRNVIALTVGALAALILISFILIFAFRSIKFGLISLIPNLTPVAMGFGLWAVVHGEIGLPLSVVLGMTMGIIIDDTVHFLSKYLRARREKGLSNEDAIVYTFTTVGGALLVTSFVLIAGFGVLAFSGFTLNSHMARLTVIVIAFALLADFFFLPPLLMLLDRKTSLS